MFTSGSSTLNFFEVTVSFRAGQRHHRGGEAHGAAHGRDVAPGQRRQRQQARPHPVRQGHRQGVRRGHQAGQGGGQAVHGQAHQNKPPAGNGERLGAAPAAPPSAGVSAEIAPLNHGCLPLAL